MRGRDQVALEAIPQSVAVVKGDIGDYDACLQAMQVGVVQTLLCHKYGLWPGSSKRLRTHGAPDRHHPLSERQNTRHVVSMHHMAV